MDVVILVYLYSSFFLKFCIILKIDTWIFAKILFAFVCKFNLIILHLKICNVSGYKMDLFIFGGLPPSL